MPYWIPQHDRNVLILRVPLVSSVAKVLAKNEECVEALFGDSRGEWAVELMLAVNSAHISQGILSAIAQLAPEFPIEMSALEVPTKLPSNTSPHASILNGVLLFFNQSFPSASSLAYVLFLL